MKDTTKTPKTERRQPKTHEDTKTPRRQREDTDEDSAKTARRQREDSAKTQPARPQRMMGMLELVRAASLVRGRNAGNGSHSLIGHRQAKKV